MALRKKILKKSRWYPVETITDEDDADNLVLLANIPAQDESQHYDQEQSAWGIGLHFNANKKEYLCFKREGAIFTLSRRPLKLVDKLTYLGSNISPTVNDVNMRLVKIWTAIDRLSVIYGSLINPIK